MPKQIRPKEIKIRLSLAEHQRLLQLAGNNALASWIRNCALGERELNLSSTHKLPPKTDPQLLHQIATIGNNLNQIARAMNTSSLSPADKLGYLTTLSQIEKTVNKLVG